MPALDVAGGEELETLEMVSPDVSSTESQVAVLHEAALRQVAVVAVDD